eukprot:COSAG01_NODE_171_length_23132_cov_53.865118_28_plen_74_part_00
MYVHVIVTPSKTVLSDHDELGLSSSTRLTRRGLLLPMSHAPAAAASIGYRGCVAVATTKPCSKPRLGGGGHVA